MRRFHVASDKDIKQAATTDVYFVRAKKVLEAKGLDSTNVVAEVTSGFLPEKWPWGVLCGVEELVRLFEGLPVNLFSVPEGTVFRPKDNRGFRLPLVRIEGPYGEFCLYETPLLGLLCQASGIATRAARMKKITGNKRVVSFGVRRMHPSISPMIDRAAYVGGVDAVSCLAGAKATRTEPVGTMPHSLIIVSGDHVDAWRAFDEVVEGKVARVALVDTYLDEKTEAIMAAEALDNLNAVRLDTPSSRKGDFAEIVREVRWELDLRGYSNVMIFASGGLNEETVKELIEAGVDAFGVGTYLSNSPTINFAMDIVEIEGKPCAKRGKLGGRKEVWRCTKCVVDVVLPYQEPSPRCPKCSGSMHRLLRHLVQHGDVISELPEPKKIQAYTLEQLEKLSLEQALEVRHSS